MTKAEERALEICPPMIVKDEDGSLDDLTYMARTWVQKGYEAAQEDLGWISAKERLPKKKGWYYSCNDDDGSPTAIGISEWDLNEWKDVGGLPDSPDYWMPIPELPKREIDMAQEDKELLLKGCKDCWHNYHCPMPQEGYNFNSDTCPYNSDNKRENYDTGR